MENHIRNNLSLFACPRCHSALIESNAVLRCSTCAAMFPFHDGLVNFAPEIRTQTGLAQKFMEAPAIVRVYERLFRPLFTRLGSPFRYADEDAYLSRYCQPAVGPVLDLACGTGRYTRLLARRFGASRLIGLDLSFAMLTEAQRIASSRDDYELLFIRGSALSLPFADASVGAVNCFGALHLFPEPLQAISEIGRILKTNGTFTCLTARHIQDRVRRQVQTLFSKVFTFRFFKDEELRAELERNKMEIVDFNHQEMALLFSARKM